LRGILVMNMFTGYAQDTPVTLCKAYTGVLELAVGIYVIHC